MIHKRRRLECKIFDILKREAELEYEIFDLLEQKAELVNDPLGYNVNFETFTFLLKYGYLDKQNEPTVDNCYSHKLISQRGTIFRTISVEPKYFDS